MLAAQGFSFSNPHENQINSQIVNLLFKIFLLILL